MNVPRRFLKLALCSALALGPAFALEEAVVSPDGRLVLTSTFGADQSLRYRVSLKSDTGESRPVVGDSAIGLVTSFRDQNGGLIRRDFTRALECEGTTRRKAVDEYQLKVGKRLANRAEFNELSLTLRNAAGAKLRVDFRAYNEGVAFRQHVLAEANPKLNAIYHTVEREVAEFNLGTAGTHFGQPYDKAGVYFPAYETPWLTSGVPAGTACDPQLGTGWGFPSLFELPAAWVLLHEVGPYGDYHAMHLGANPENGIYQIVPPLAEEAGGLGENKAAHPLPWSLPWRMIAVSEEPAGIVESNLVFHLAEPCRVKDASWIKPGCVSWSWLSDHASSRNEAALRKFIDFSARMGWPYSLVDANWNTIRESALEDLTRYAAAKGVGLLFWYNSGGPHNWVQEEPRNLMHERSARRAEFAKLRRLGVKGVKIDFFQSDKQFVMRQYVEILEDAAEFHIMVDFHGCTIPRGWERTFPNLMTMEAVRGAENYTFGGSTYARLAPSQNALLPFTRNVIGSMDYTPVGFSFFTSKRVTTNAHEAALAVIFESGLQHFSDSVESYQSLPAPYQDYLRNIPSVWDETRLLAGYPGRFVVLARRSGSAWHVAGINGEAAPRTVKLKLPFLPKGGSTLLHDTEHPGEFASKPLPLDPAGETELTLRPFGGFVLVPTVR